MSGQPSSENLRALSLLSNEHVKYILGDSKEHAAKWQDSIALVTSEVKKRESEKSNSIVKSN